MDNNQSQLVFAFDGDGIGKRHAKAILSDDLDQVREVSALITQGNNYIQEFVESNGGTWVSGGGDEGSFTAPAEFVDNLDQIRKDYEYMVGATLSIGYGSTISQAGKALLAAKARGKNQVVQYDESVEVDLKNAQEKAGSDEEQERKKISEVTNNEPTDKEKVEAVGGSSDSVLPENEDSQENEPTLSEPPVKDNNLGYDSGYKNDSQEQRIESYKSNDETPPAIIKPNLIQKPLVREAVSADVPESDRYMNEVLPDPQDQEPTYRKPGDLKYSGDAGEAIEPQADMPTEDSTSDVAMQTEQEDMDPDAHCPSCTCGQENADVGDVLDQHIDNAKDFSDSIGSNQEEDGEDVLDQHIDNANELNDRMENGTSRPENYDEGQNDLGLSEDEADEDSPDLSEVLRGGLDQHAHGIQKERVIDMVGQALEGFKNQKSMLDKAKDQAPELYDSCIAMLRAMIELCSLAGIDQGQAEQEVNEIEGQSESPEEQPGAEEMPDQAGSEEDPAQSPQQ